MPPNLTTFFAILILFFLFIPSGTAGSVTAYANDFVDLDYILAGSFAPQTERARMTILQWARSLASDGPWSA